MGQDTWPVKKHRTPKIGEIHAKNLDYLTTNECEAIHKLTGYDPYNPPEGWTTGSTLALVGWFSIALRGEWAGISLDEVRDWPLGVFSFDAPDDDADDVRAAAEDLSDADPGADDEPPFTGPSEPA